MFLLRAICFVTLQLLLLPHVVLAQDCTKELAEAERISRSLSSSLIASSPIKVGDNFRIRWRTSLSTFTQAPVYLIVATEDDARFAGNRFLSLTPGAVAPRKIAYGVDRSRAFVALDRQMSPGIVGDIQVFPRSARSYRTTVAIVYGGSCGEKILSEVKYQISVAAGPANVVVQDRFSTAIPQKTIMSIDRKHVLRVFPDRYEISIASSGDVVLTGSGRDPNFSPSGRFLAVKHTADGGVDIFDLAGAPEAMKFDGASIEVESLIWSNKDSYLIISNQRWGNLSVLNATNNSEAILGGIEHCHACSGTQDAYVMIDIDRGIGATLPTKDLMLSDGKVPVTDLFRRYPAEYMPLKQVVSYVRFNYGSDLQELPKTWQMLGGPLYSHMSFWEPSLDEVEKAKSKGEKKQLLAARTNARKQYEKIVQHIDLTRVKASSPQIAANQIAGVFRGGRSSQGILADLTTQQNLEDRLSQVGVKLVASKPVSLSYKLEGSKYQQPESNVRNLRSVASSIKGGLDVSGNNPILKEDPCVGWGLENVDLFSEANRIFRWDRADKTFWFVNVQCMQGSAANFYSKMYLVQRTGSSSELFDIKAGFGGTGGAWADGVERVDAHMLSDTRIAFTSPIADSAFVIDVTKPHDKAIGLTLTEAPLLTALRMTDDERHLVQFNSDGRLSMISLSDGRTVLTGAYADDEIVLSTAEGLYDSTFEGAQLVNVRFAGVAGTHRFDQFERILFKPGLAQMVMSGGSPMPPAGIAAPPSAILHVDKEGKDGKRDGVVRFSSDSQVREVKVMVDGRTVQTITAQLGSSETKFSIADPGAGHWISAVAVNAAGLISLPSAAKIPGVYAANGELNTVLVGVDRYGDRRISPLRQAKYDAQNLGKALSALKGRTFSRINEKLVLDEDATRDRVLAEIRAAAERTGTNDRLVVYFAGHGVDGKDYGDTESALYLVAHNTVMDDVRSTAIPWTRISDALSVARGTVIVVLDACHSGFAGKREPLSNDESAKAMLTRSGAPMLILAASKGRQQSEESDAAGGKFTNAIVATLGKTANAAEPATLTSFYESVKSIVIKETDNRQTPWMVRSGLAGEMTLF